MRIKASSLVIKFGRAAVLLMFLFAEFFGFGIVKPHMALAACSYQITEFAAKNPSNWSYIHSATPADTIAIVSTLKKSGTATECSGTGTANIVDQIDGCRKKRDRRGGNRGMQHGVRRAETDR
jgi:hypothetical protein